MNFKSEYDHFIRNKLSCNFLKEFNLDKIMLGNGGSENIILRVVDKDDNDVILKIFVENIEKNLKKKKDFNMIEIKIYKFLTNEYLLKNRTPHIVGMIQWTECNDIRRLMRLLVQNNKVCMNDDQKLLAKKHDILRDKMCEILLKSEMKILEPNYQIAMLENCEGNLADLLVYRIEKLKNEKNLSKDIYLLKEFLYTIFFQIIFTLAIIKDDNPGFLHGDLFIRNILYRFETEHHLRHYIAYHYKKKIFYLPANNIYIKISDFGYSMIADKIQSKLFDKKDPIMKYMHMDPYDKKTDIFTFLHDIYDGGDVGAYSISTLFKNNQIDKNTISSIRKLLNKFIDLKTIDYINKYNRYRLDTTWKISGIELLEKTVLTPKEYLESDVFHCFKKLPSKSHIIHHYNIN